MLQRLRSKKSVYNVSKWEDEDHQRQKYLKNISQFQENRFPNIITPIKERANSSTMVRSGGRSGSYNSATKNNSLSNIAPINNSINLSAFKKNQMGSFRRPSIGGGPLNGGRS